MLPKKYESMIKNIKNKVIINIYSKFIFNYYNIPNIDNDFITNLYNYLIKFKFIVYNLPNQSINATKSLSKKSSINKDTNLISFSQQDIIFCVENKCIIVENISNNIINDFIRKIKKSHISIKNACDEVIMNDIQSFYNYFNNEITNNKFVKYTITPIIGYLIHMYFYPTKFFKDKSFFNFNNLANTKEQEAKTKLKSYLLCNSKYNIIYENEEIFEQIFNDIFLLKEEPKPNSNIDTNINNFIYKFKETDFIKLRTIYNNVNSNYFFVIHLDTLYIFLMKRFNDPNLKTKEMKHEIEFNESYSHRCLTKFYGFLYENNSITGIIYEFMCNNTLTFFLENEKNDETFLMITISRIFQGIKYLHSKKLIHRDLKPLNILVDHDGLPYISDFETIRSIKGSDSINEIFTNDIGSQLYSSPEQDLGENISFSTDIYSFGLIIFYLFEKYDMWSKSYFNKCKMITKMKNGPINFRHLYEKCVIYNQEERIGIDKINDIIIDEFNLFILKYINNDLNTLNFLHHCNFIIENILIQKNIEYMYFCHNYIQYFRQLYLFDNNLSHVSSELYKMAQDLNYSNALSIFGNLYANGLGVEQDYSLAIKYYEESAKLDDPNSLFKLGYLYENGLGVKKNYSIAMKYYEESSKHNNSDALLNLGNLYSHGRGVKQNYSIALNYYKESAKLNNSNALLNLGDLYMLGLGVAQDYTIGIKCYVFALKLKNPNAFYNIGCAYKNGLGVKQDYSKAKFFFEESAKFNNSFALFELGYIYEKGRDVEKNIPKAIECYEKSAELNNSEALYYLGIHYLEGIEVKQDYLKAIEYFEKSAKLNHSDALSILGVIYYQGLGVEQDFLKAIEYFEKSAKLNNSSALFNLGILYLFGRGVKKDCSLAIKYFEKSSNLNNPNAQLYLGSIYTTNEFIEHNYSLAIKYLEKSSRLNNSEALLNLGILYENGQGVKQNYFIAKKYYELASKYNNSEALLHLGRFYLYGIGTKKNYSLAIKCYEESSKLNNLKAHLILGDLFSDNDIFKFDFTYAIKYYLKSIKAHKGITSTNDSINKNTIVRYYCNNQRFISYNNLGLIYIIVMDDIEKGEEYLKESVFAEYPFGQNNFGLFNLFYLKNIQMAEHMYKRSSQHNFSLAFYNLGYMFEKKQ